MENIIFAVFIIVCWLIAIYIARKTIKISYEKDIKMLEIIVTLNDNDKILHKGFKESVEVMCSMNDRIKIMERYINNLEIRLKVLDKKPVSKKK